MVASSHRRLRGVATAFVLLALAAAVPAVPASALPPVPASPAFLQAAAQEPGVTLRVYDTQTPLTELCVLKPGQTPNVDKLVPQIDITSPDVFEFSDNFSAEVLGNLTIATAGTYEFRLRSDDGSRLLIGGELVVDHDGLHMAEPKDGDVDLGAGLHPLRIDYFERDGLQQLTLEWKPPGADGFSVVPNAVLSTEADVVRVTSPGTKECEASGDAPGDGLPLDAVHPSFTLTDLRPAGFEPKVTGMDWLPDGRLAVLTWGGQDDSGTSAAGELWLLGNAQTATSPDQVTLTKVCEGLRQPMGLKYLDGTFFVSETDRLTECRDTSGDGVADEKITVATWPWSGNFHEFAFGLLYRDGFFYLNLSVAIDYGGNTTNPQPSAQGGSTQRGSTIKVDRRTGEVSYVAGGLRTPHGIGWGPGDDLFVTDNQGGWLPASKLVHIEQDRFFNHYTNPPGLFESNPVTPPVLWMPQNEIANSPSTPLLIEEGPFAGQLFIGDVTYGGIQRAYLEQVGGAYQGALFRLTQGLEAGVSELSLGPDGSVYVGGLGAGGNWGQAGKLTYGLQRLTPNDTTTFDILAMRAVPGGFELEYTQPLSAGTAAALAGRYDVEHWRYEPTASYGGPKIDEETLDVTSATLSADGRKVTLQVAGLEAGRVVHVRSPRPFSSASGQSLWSTEAWYTLNALPPGSPTSGVLQAEDAALSGGATVADNHPGYTGSGFVDGYWNQGATTTFTVNAEAAGPHDVTLRYGNGPDPFQGTKTLSLSVNGTDAGQVTLATTGDWQTWAEDTVSVDLQAGSNTITYARGSGDSGNVNLDRIAVTPGDGEPQRITLFDGDDLDAWEKTDGSAATWPVADGSMESFGGDIRTKQEFDDFTLHVEFLVPQLPPEQTGQQRGNSGVYLQERYEVQILDSYGDTTLSDDELGGIYSKRAPDSNAALPPGEWQTYDITFRAARYDASGNKIANARATVVLNGTTIHDDVEIDGATGGGIGEGPLGGAIRLQDHGDPNANPRFRNIWIEPA